MPDAPTLSLVVLAASIGSGLMAGLFFIFSNTVMPALAALPAARAVAAMQSINLKIVNLAFLVVFLGTPVACAVLLVQGVLDDAMPARAVVLSGSAVYLVGSLLVTVAGNVPLNNRLAVVEPEGADAEAAWRAFYGPWLRWNHVRTLASLVAMICFAVGYAAWVAAG